MSATPNPPPVYSGEFCHGLDPKNRVTIPSRWRSGEAEDFFLMLDRSGRFLRAMPGDEFRKVAQRVEANDKIPPREKAVFLRQFYAKSQLATADKQGRLVLPPEFCQALNLAGEIMLVGAYRTFEFWNKDAWQAAQTQEADIFDRVADAEGL